MKYRYKVSVDLEFTRDELKLLGFLAQHHYDSVCQSIARPGGFLYGMNFLNEQLPGAAHVLSFQEIDTLCKVLELAGMWGPSSLLEMAQPESAKLAEALTVRLRDALCDLQNESRRLNEGSG